MCFIATGWFWFTAFAYLGQEFHIMSTTGYDPTQRPLLKELTWLSKLNFATEAAVCYLHAWLKR